jgi:heat shock protein HtpX
MRYLQWLTAPVLVVSLLGHIWVYSSYLLGFSNTWMVIIAGGLLVFAALCLLLLRMFCRRLFKRAMFPAWMMQFVAQLSGRLGIRQPALYALATEGINAFALGDAGSSGVVFFHGPLLAHLTQDEVESVLAHEFSHLAAGHARVMTFLQGMTAPLLAPPAACVAFFMSLLFGIRGFRQHFVQVYHMLSVLLFPLTTLLIALVMRQWEYAADAQAARLVGKAKYITALQCLHGSFFQHPDLLNLSPAQVDSQKDQWALSHPSLKQRIHALREVG